MKSSFTRSCVMCIASLASASAITACAPSDAEVEYPIAGHGAAAGSSAAGSTAAGSGGIGASAGITGGAAGVSGIGVAGSGGATAGVSGSLAQAGSAGSLTAGSGGVGPSAGASGGAAGSGDGTGGGLCPAQYTMATHVVIDVSWKGSLATQAGTGKVHLWTKSKFNKSGNTASVETQTCGTILPVITTTAIAGNSKILPEIPDASWDIASMPRFNGTATWTASGMSIDPGVALIGLSMTDPAAAWPAAGKDITSVDHDGDGKGGITANSKDGNGFSAPPTSLLQTARADKLYLAIRNVMTLSSDVTGCPETYSGTAQVTHFDNHVVGCHVKGGGECSASEASFVDDNRTVYTVTAAAYDTKLVADTATCADARTALPIQ